MKVGGGEGLIRVVLKNVLCVLDNNSDMYKQEKVRELTRFV